MTPPDQRPRVTIVTPVFNEEQTLPLYRAAVEQALLRSEEYDFRVLFIDDGSSDASWRTICEISRQDPRFRGRRLSRNFGANVADTAGLAVADGDAVAVLACDLQDPPEVILQFLEQWRRGARIVWGRRRSRGDALWRVVVSSLFFRTMRAIAMPRGSKFQTGGFFLADRRVVESFRQFPETNRIVFALMAWTGFDQAVVDYDRKPRAAGTSGWSAERMLRAMYDGIIGFSPLPVRLITLIGVLAFFFSFLVAGYLLYCKLTGSPMLGWTGIMLAISVFSGIQFLLTGLVGEYLYRIYAEVTRRPLYFVSDETPDG